MRGKLAAALMALASVLAAQAPTPADEQVAIRLAGLKTDGERRQLLDTEHIAVTPSLIQAIVNNGNKIFLKPDYAGALDHYRFALNLAEQAGDRAMQGSCLYTVGYALVQLGDLEQSLDAYSRSVELARELGISAWALASRLNGLSIVQRRLGNYSAAAQAARDSVAAAQSITPEELREPLAVAQHISAKLMTAQALNSLGGAERMMGDYRSALDTYAKSYRLALELNQRQGAAFVMNNIGIIYEGQGNLELALDYFQKSLKLKQESGSQTAMDNGFNNIGSIETKLGRYRQALEDFMMGRRLAEGSGSKDGIAHALFGIADVERRQGELSQAAEDFAQSAATYHAMGAPTGESEALTGLADVQVASKAYEKAAVTASRASSLARQAEDPEMMYYASTAAGRANLLLGKRAEARKAFVESIAAIESLRERLAGGEEVQERFFEDKLSPYSGMMQIALAERRPEEALGFAERAKARVLLDVFERGRVPIAKAMTREEKSREQAFHGQIASLNTRLSEEKSRTTVSSDRIAQLRKRLDKTRLDYGAFETSLYGAHPLLRANRIETPLPSVRELAARLTYGQSAALEYVVTAEDTFLFVVSRTAPYLRHFSIHISSAELNAKVRRFSEKLGRRDLDFGADAQELYRLLVAPAEEALREKTTLVIVPDGVLWQLPFQALATAADRYLIERSSIFYAPSLTVLSEMLRRHPPARQPRSLTVLAVGNPTGPAASLPDAETEVNALREIYGTANSTILIGEEATEAVFKQQASKFAVLHVAAHAVLDDRSPLYSHLVLSPGGGANEDGLLEAREMMDLDLKAEVVVLSACETARGRLGGGEGLIGMTWALFIAGSPATVATSWKIDSASAARFTVEFHRRLKEGQSKTAAMRQAALAVMKLPGYQHPYFWSSFSLVGQGF